MAEIVLGRLKFKWQGAWATATAYIKDDVVRYGGSSYVCILNHTSGGSFATDLAASKWELMLEGGTPTTTQGDLIYRGVSSDQRLPIGNEGSLLTVSGQVPDWLTPGASGEALIINDNGVPEWQGLATAQDIYYVKADGNDDNDGTNLNEAFRTIRHACDTVTGPATIYVRGGLYYEQLPITVGANVTIVGDGQRITGVAPLNVTATSADVFEQLIATTSTTIELANGNITGPGFQIGCEITGTSITGTVTVTGIDEDTPNPGFTQLTVSFSSQTVASEICTITSDYSQGTMWQLNDGSTLNKMYFRDMAGFTPNLGSPEDITQATIAGVFVAFDPANPIVNKSPYVIECAAFSEDGAIGALVDGDVHASGLKSMVFHGYTIVCSDGAGFWVHGEGKSEIVSCFTYYCWFGYTTTGGGKIRALNGNNSYGTYGVVSRGFLSTETPVAGALYGDMITYTAVSLSGEFLVSETVTGSISGATGTVTNVQTAADKFYYTSTSGIFQVGETVTGGTSGASATIAAGGVSGQKGFVLVADGFGEEPRPGGAVSLTGDGGSYIIQSVSGTYVNSSSVMIIVLANEKITASTDNTALTIRYAYSNARLTGHDFLSIGTGDKTTTNYPGEPTQSASQANEVIESLPGRVFYVSTDQDGNFRVGDYFRVDQATGKATLNASAFDLSGLSSLRLGSIGAQLGESINEFSSDYTLSGNSNLAVPTEAAVRNYFGVVATNVVPVNDNILTLGTPTKRWNHVYVGPGSVTIGSLTITDDGGSLAVNQTNNAPATINIAELDTGNIRYFQNNIIGTNSNENIVITPSGTGGVLIDGVNVNGTTIDSNDSSGIVFTPTVTVNSDLNVENDVSVTNKITTKDILVTGNMTVSGTQTVINSTNLNIADSLIYMGDNNPSDVIDIGIISSFTNPSYQHTGLVRDASDGVWKLFKDVVDEPTTTVNFTAATYSDLKLGNLSTTGDVDLAISKAYKINGASVLNGNTLGSSVTASSLTSVGTLTSLTTSGTIAANGSGGVTTNQTTFPLVNATATTVNFAGAATAINMGANTGTLTIGNPTVVGTQATQALYNTTATTVNAFGAATALNMGAATGTLTIGNATITGTNAATLNMNGANPSIITTSTGTASVFNTNALTGNLFGAATAINIGISGGASTVVTVGGATAGRLAVAFNQSSTSTSTGALTVAGGVGVAGNIYAGAVYDNGTRVASTGKAIAMAMVFG